MSINQNPRAGALPDFRNVGVLMRIVLTVVVLQLAVAVSRAASWSDVLDELIELSALAQPVLILSIAALALLAPWLSRLPYAAGIAAVMALALVMTGGVQLAVGEFGTGAAVPAGRPFAFALVATAAVLAYFHLRSRALSPAVTEARLQALQARIRPHFLFNSLNAVLSLIRQDPRRAETALEDLAELFRAMLADNRPLWPLAREVGLCRQYLQLEQLRLGERLRVEWHTAEMPPDAMVPPLLLQPLLENAVYHGIEPRTEPGAISIEIRRSGEKVEALLANPLGSSGSHHSGNRMALDNIRERLALNYDAEAQLTAGERDGSFEVRIVLPYVRNP